MLNDSLFHVPYIGQLALHVTTDFSTFIWTTRFDQMTDVWNLPGDVSEVFNAYIIRAPLKRRVISETTRRNFPEESHLHTRRRKNMKSQTGRNVWHNWVL
jgi:hypothetical protein